MRFTRIALALAVSAMFASTGLAAPVLPTATWSGSIDGLWSTPTNWVSNFTPTNNRDIYFTGTSNLTNTNDLSSTNSYARLFFTSSAGNFVLNGNNLIFGGSGIFHQGTNQIQTINNAVTFTAASNITANNAASAILLNGPLSIADNTFLNGSGTVTINGSISGAGNLQIGNGIIALTNSNSYSGGTTVLGNSTLLLGNGNALGTGGVSLSGLIVSTTNINLANTIGLGGTTTFSGGTVTTLSGVLSGSGDLNVAPGTTVVIANTNNTYTGTSTVVGRLQGNGTLGTVVNTSTGVVAPGNSIGTLNTANFLQSAGTLEIEVSQTSSDRVNVTGTAAVTGGTINVVPTTGVLPGTAWAVITTGTGITFTPTTVTVTDSSAILAFTATNVGNNLNVVASTDTNGMLAAASSTNNQKMALALARELNQDGVNLGLLPATMLNASELDRLLSELSPERLQALAHVNVYSVQSFNNALFGAMGANSTGGIAAANVDPMSGLSSTGQDTAMLASLVQSGNLAATAPAYPIQFFARGYGSFNNSDSAANHTGYSADTGGGLFGADFALGNELTVGLVVGYSHTKVDFDAALGTQKDDTLRVGPFATYRVGDLGIDGALTYGYHWAKMDTTVLGLPADADYNAWDFTAYGRVGYDVKVTESVKVTPFAGLQYVTYHQDSYAQTGAGGFVNVNANTFDSLRSFLGARVSLSTELGGIKLVPEASVGWAHEFMGDNDSISGSFIGGGTPFTVNTSGIDADSLVTGAGVTAVLNDRLSVYARYDGEFGSNHEIHTVSGGISIRF